VEGRRARLDAFAGRLLNIIPSVPTLTVYEKPTCSTCRNLRALLTERGVAFESIDYHVRGIEEDELRELLDKLGGSPRGVLRTREPLVKELGLDRPEVSGDELIAQMVAHPALLQRPIVLCGDRAVLARPVERALELL
jgi:arsenate reductase (glutaredoxin)